MFHCSVSQLSIRLSGSFFSPPARYLKKYLIFVASYATILFLRSHISFPIFPASLLPTLPSANCQSLCLFVTLLLLLPPASLGAPCVHLTGTLAVIPLIYPGDHRPSETEVEEGDSETRRRSKWKKEISRVYFLILCCLALDNHTYVAPTLAC